MFEAGVPKEGEACAEVWQCVRAGGMCKTAARFSRCRGCSLRHLVGVAAAPKTKPCNWPGFSALLLISLPGMRRKSLFLSLAPFFLSSYFPLHIFLILMFILYF